MSYGERSISNAILQVVETIQEKDQLSQEEREIRAKKAAYALNLCTVSVAQIIDYDDVAVMEYEYEAILNNLNLQNMPSDQALLNILNHILDTITFFRIQEKERVLVEKRYQNQIKNAIWEAVPSLSILTNWRDPLNIAQTVGLSYMNYRRKKAEYQLEKEFEDFRLERAAIDQFNNLQRELFDTSWRLSATYKFEDKFRLTERQIKQYNAILQDEDPIRRLERLQSVKENFIAYPPYWYYLGHAALEIINIDERGKKVLSDKKKHDLKRMAQESFEQLLSDKLYDILREDPVVSACALEYIDMLDAEKDKEKIDQLIKEALQMSGNAYDVWQLCALAYLRINKMEEACGLLRRLVNEKYNEETNAQLLSSIYMKIYVYSGLEGALEDYQLLLSRAHEYVLFPIPEERTVDDYNECQQKFVDQKKHSLLERYGNVLFKFMRVYASEFEKICNKLQYQCTSDKAEIIDYINKILLYCYELPGMSVSMQNDILNQVSEKLKKEEKKFVFEKNEKNGGKKFGEELFIEIMYSAFHTIGSMIETYIGTAFSLDDISEVENKLISFCELTGIVETSDMQLFEQENQKEHLLNIEVFGELSEERKKYGNQYKKAMDIVRSYAATVIQKDCQTTKLWINDKNNSMFYEKYFRDSIFNFRCYRDIPKETIAIISNSQSQDDLLISVTGIRRYLTKRLSGIIRFDEVNWGTRGKEELIIGSVLFRKYDNPDVKMAELLGMFRELKDNVEERYDETDKKNPFYMLMKA